MSADLDADDVTPLPAAVSGHADPEGSAPWALQFVVRVERADPPSHSAVCAAVATATVLLLDDERCAPGGMWHPAVQRWMEGRIRKHVRRARGASFERLAELDGLAVSVGDVELIVFPPCPTDAVPRLVSRCQLSGLELTDPDDLDLSCVERSGAAPVVSLSADPVLSTGKAAAAAAHAAQLAFITMDDVRRARWREERFAVRVEQPSLERWRERIASAQVVVRDAGFTEVDPHTVTSTATWV